MSFYDSEKAWAAPGRQPSWEQPPPSRSGAASAASQQHESSAFASQFEEIDRATDNLVKSGKWLPGQMQTITGGMSGASARRESTSTAGRGYEGYSGSSDPRMGGGPSRHQSVSEYDGGRPGSAGLQGYYAGQRFPGGRQSEAEQMLQSKRRMAAQRERELRNYHQEQQYNRTSVSGAPKSDRSMSPNTMSEDDRRDLIARQHRALYGDNSQLYGTEGSGSRPPSQDVRVSGSQRGPSPLAFDPYSVQTQTGSEGSVQMPPRERVNSNASPASNSTAQQSFALLNDAQQSSRTSASSPGASPPLQQGQKGVAPIGTRPIQPPGVATGNLNKRSTTPLTPSSLSYGYTSTDAHIANNVKDERSTSSASNPPLADKNVSGLGGWGGNSAVWGSGKNTLAVQPSVWG
ncbi:hypothetical protein LTR08_002461 [Meristemomyces frigidus]|nr:hypothetical protein LTR08_002461 [Meristemomyces frigidus]